jgi:glutamyl-tRNA synthetase
MRSPAPDEILHRVAMGAVLRFRVPDGAIPSGTTSCTADYVPEQDIEDFVILRSDVTPIDNMAVVSDDMMRA